MELHNASIKYYIMAVRRKDEKTYTKVLSWEIRRKLFGRGRRFLIILRLLCCSREADIFEPSL